MGVKLANNARSLLAASITAAETVVTVQAGHGGRFPTITEANQWFPLALENELGEIEYLRCTGRTGDALTVERGQEGSAARSYGAGDLIEVRLTAAAAIELAQVEDPEEPATPQYADGTPIDELRPAEAGATRNVLGDATIGGLNVAADDVIDSLITNALTVAQEALRNGTWRAQIDQVLRPTAGLTIRQLVEQLGVTVNDVKSFVNFLREIDTDGNGKVLLTINSNGQITGTLNTLTGGIGTFKVMADIIEFIDPDSGTARKPFSYGLDNVLRLTNVEVDTIKANSISLTQVKDELSETIEFTAGDKTITEAEQTLIETPPFAIGDSQAGRALTTISFLHDATATTDVGTRVRLYVDLGAGAGYQLKQSFVVGARTNRGDTVLSLPIAFFETISSTHLVRMKVTVQGERILGVGRYVGHAARNPRISGLLIGR